AAPTPPPAPPAAPPPVASAPPAPPAGPAKTEILWDEEAALVLGEHPFMWRQLYRVKGNKRGALTIVDEGGVWKISGRHQGRTPETKEDYVTIKGVITAITAGTFVVNGDIEFFAAKMNKGAACRITGESRFIRRPHEQIWRLQNGSNPCSGPKDALDVAFRPDQVAAQRKPKRRPPSQVPPKIAPVSPTVKQ
ncbi:MAG: hypothetical protein AB7G10_28340, partial [Reyranellaceae bacterium]